MQETKNHKTVDDNAVLSSIFAGVSVYFNYTGTAKCLKLSGPDQIGTDMWDYQVFTKYITRLSVAYDPVAN